MARPGELQSQIVRLEAEVKKLRKQRDDERRFLDIKRETAELKNLESKRKLITEEYEELIERGEKKSADILESANKKSSAIIYGAKAKASEAQILAEAVSREARNRMNGCEARERKMIEQDKALFDKQNKLNDAEAALRVRENSFRKRAGAAIKALGEI